MISAAERFWAKVDVRGPDECWEWQGAKLPKGHGQFRVSTQKRVTAHRFSWEFHFGPIPDGLYVCHHCDNKLCVNPSHLFPGSNSDNQLDAVRKGKHWTAARKKVTTALDTEARR